MKLPDLDVTKGGCRLYDFTSRGCHQCHTRVLSNCLPPFSSRRPSDKHRIKTENKVSAGLRILPLPAPPHRHFLPPFSLAALHPQQFFFPDNGAIWMARFKFTAACRQNLMVVSQMELRPRWVCKVTGSDRRGKVQPRTRTCSTQRNHVPPTSTDPLIELSCILPSFLLSFLSSCLL